MKFNLTYLAALVAFIAIAEAATPAAQSYSYQAFSDAKCKKAVGKKVTLKQAQFDTGKCFLVPAGSHLEVTHTGTITNECELFFFSDTQCFDYVGNARNDSGACTASPVSGGKPVKAINVECGG